MFAPRPDVVAEELLRVCSPGGTIAMGNWTPEGFVGQMFKTFARFIAPSGMPAPVLWGDENVVRTRLGGGSSDLTMTTPSLSFQLPISAGGSGRAFQAELRADPSRLCLIERNGRRDTAPGTGGLMVIAQPRRRRTHRGAGGIPGGDRHSGLNVQGRRRKSRNRCHPHIRGNANVRVRRRLVLPQGRRCFFLAQICVRIFGQTVTVTLTSPRWALWRSSIRRTTGPCLRQWRSKSRMKLQVPVRTVHAGEVEGTRQGFMSAV